MDHNIIEGVILDRYLSLQRQNDLVPTIFASFGSDATLHIIGGWLRDIVHNLHWRTSLGSPDVDVVFQAQNIPAMFAQWERTAFAGYTKRIGDISFDFWRLEDTWTFKENYFIPSFPNLMKSVSFTVDAIAFEIGTNRLIGDEALQDIAAKKLVLNCNVYLDKLGSLQAFRAAKMCAKYGYVVTEDTKVSLRNCLKPDALKECIRREATGTAFEVDQFVAEWYRKVTELLGFAS